MYVMKKLDRQTRAQVLHLLCEGNSIRGTARLTGVSKTTILKLVVDAGEAASWYQDRVFQNLPCQRLQLDELWAFVGAKQANADPELKAAGRAGDVWLWVATCADTKLVPSWLVGDRGIDTAVLFTDDLKSRLAHRVQVTSDAHRAYLAAMEKSFGDDVDYGMLVKIYAPPGGKSEHRRYSPAICTGAHKRTIVGDPRREDISTSYAERNNLTARMHSRRLTRLTNAFSKEVQNHAHAMALHFLYYNFVRIHQTVKMTPAMAAGVTKRLWEMSDVVDVLEAWEGSR
jgi:IS1 family transposase